MHSLPGLACGSVVAGQHAGADLSIVERQLVLGQHELPFVANEVQGHARELLAAPGGIAGEVGAWGSILSHLMLSVLSER